MESLVIAPGTGKTEDKGKKVPFEVKRGPRASGQVWRHEIKLDGKEYRILTSDEVLAVIE